MPMRVIRPVWTFLGVFFKRLLPVATFAVLFIIIASIIDRGITQNRPATDYVNYYRFYVPNAREGEDLYFTVCRTHDSNFNYNGNLLIYVQPIEENANETKVFTKEIGGTMRPGECEDKLLRASEFSHSPGKYKMYINVTFREPKYEMEKTASYSSNVYSIYAQPDDVRGRIEYLEQQLRQAKRDLREAQENQPAPQNDLTAPSAVPQSSQSAPSSRPSSSNGNTPSPQQPSAPTQPREPETREVCTLNLLGLKVGCRQVRVE